MQQPNILKRLLATFYDSFLVLATIFIAVALTLPFTKGEVAAEKNIFMTLYILVVIYLFYGWFWTHGGQTLGMRSWKQKLVSNDGNNVNWKQTFIRFITGLPAWCVFIIGISLWALPDKFKLAEGFISIPAWLFITTGFIWVLLDIRNNNWRDKLSGTKIIIADNKTKLS